MSENMHAHVTILVLLQSYVLFHLKTFVKNSFMNYAFKHQKPKHKNKKFTTIYNKS